jgi:sensor histidine kinase YesM
VTDNGPGPHGAVELGVGLRNTNARLREMYGPLHAVTLRTADRGGTEAKIVLPYHTTSTAPGAR